VIGGWWTWRDVTKCSWAIFSSSMGWVFEHGTSWIPNRNANHSTTISGKMMACGHLQTLVKAVTWWMYNNTIQARTGSSEVMYWSHVCLSYHAMVRVCIATGYVLDGSGSIPCSARSSSSPQCSDYSGAHPASYTVGTRGSFPTDKAAGAWSWPLTSI
jgi:hypothetical protein